MASRLKSATKEFRAEFVVSDDVVRTAGGRSLCGRGRCSTCRVRIAFGIRYMEDPAPAEQELLDKIGAPPTVRLQRRVRVMNIAILFAYQCAGARNRSMSTLSSGRTSCRNECQKIRMPGPRIGWRDLRQIGLGTFAQVIAAKRLV